MEIDGVFSGGGMKAIAFVGAIEVMEQEGYKFKNVAGTSAGAIISALLVAGFKAKDLHQILTEVDFKKFMDRPQTITLFPFLKWASFYWKMGMFKGDALENWMGDLLKKRGIATFGDIEDGTLKIIASDLTRGRIMILPDDLEQYGLNKDQFSIAKAVRMSASIPYFFEPVKIYDRSGMKSVIVDGAVLSNFPIWLFEEKKKRPVIGFRLSPQLENIPPNIINNAVDMFPALIETMLHSHDNRYISKKVAEQIIFIPIDTVRATEFNLSRKEKKQLVEIGRKRAHEFIQKWKGFQ
ncbi:patatin-like phospholipase family protein [Calidifontibacillus erzurumensis]|uniref:Patatin-like phospholipase family protein n=1 Tax=Calidifontibacillus erzurumensis TaxID=2741433 RepID=A0A8J8GB86_9BACI|nr:patatin-like phospholipase family protein [Calidifontibacillus erzurumensis]NSL50369.1 patatin-like phospholipase family protein [Calidifontibacillus erzurumensis]